MPLYDLVCDTCHCTKNDYYSLTSEDIPVCCNKKMRKKIGRIGIGFPKGGITLTNVENNPVHFDSKSQMQKYARDNNLELGALL